MTESPRTALVSIDDAIFRLDVESAFSGAGYRIVRSVRGAGSRVGNESISVALIDTDQPHDRTMALIRAARRLKIPIMAFTSSEPDGTMPELLGHEACLIKPLATDDLVAHVSAVLDGGGTAWTGDAHAGEYGTD